MDSLPSISFLVPTHREDRPLYRCLESIYKQLGPHDEVIVIGDITDRAMPMVERLVASYGTQFKYLSHTTGQHTYGHDQLNYGIEHAKGDWLHCNDDDDVWTPGCVDIMRSAAIESKDRPILFRFLSYHGIIFWVERGMFEYERVGGHCLFTPNISGKVGKWTSRYQGDWDYIESTVNLHGGPESIIWREEIVAVARP